MKYICYNAYEIKDIVDPLHEEISAIRRFQSNTSLTIWLHFGQPQDILGVLSIIEGSEKMFFRNKIVALNDESKFTLKIGHDRNGILIIKELSVKANNVDELIEKTKEALSEFNQMKFDVIKGEMKE